MNHRERLLVVVGGLVLALAVTFLFLGAPVNVSLRLYKTPSASPGGASTPAAVSTPSPGGQSGGAKKVPPTPSANPLSIPKECRYRRGNLEAVPTA